ncbi:MAG: alpha/beta fold hydrolase [Gemmatimonadota bacterium]
MRTPEAVLAAAVALILGGGLLAWSIQTGGGAVEVRDVRWVAPSGTGMSGLLYIPEGATVENPAPGILAVHGYINSRETQAGFAIEFARRGYVVLALDQTGHGYSDPPAFAEGFGGPAGLRYLRSLEFVDTTNVGLEGHSMGGWAASAAIAAHPDGYRSTVLAGSSPGAFGAPAGSPEEPRNLGLIWSRWDEFSQTMWASAVPSDVRRGERLKAVFGTVEDVEPGRLYGSIEEGTGRMLFEPRTNHPGDHLSPTAIGNAVQWFQTTLEGGNDLPPSNQIWYWKEIGTLLAAVGMILLLFPVGTILLRSSYFSALREPPAPSRARAGTGWWVAAVLTAALGPLTLFPFKDLPTVIGWAPGPVFPQSITNSVIAWTTVLGLATIALFVVWHAMQNRHAAGSRDAYGLTWGGRVLWRRIAKSLLLAFLIVLTGYASLAVTDYLFTVDFRFWVFAIKPMSPLQLRMALVYLIPLAFYFIVLNVVLFGQLRRDEWSARRAMLVNLGVLVLGWVVLYVVQYAPLLAGGTMTIADEPLWTIIAYQLLPLMMIAGLVLTYFNRRTGHVYVGGFVAAMLVTWIVVASQATHYAA